MLFFLILRILIRLEIEIIMAQPLFKYIGGKRWLREELRYQVQEVLNHNPHIDTYMEPFAGGLGAFFSIHDLLSHHGIKKVILNDINGIVINFYQAVKTQPQALITECLHLEKRFEQTYCKHLNGLNKVTDKGLLKEAESFYKTQRQIFNQLKKQKNITPRENLKLSATLLFLQTHCFNGIYRENAKGEHNTPFNWEGKIISPLTLKNKILQAHDVFQNLHVVFSHESFEKLTPTKNTLLYLDPPYINESKGENKYHQDAFGIAKQEDLIAFIHSFAFIYSNHYHADLLNMFSRYVQTDIIIKEIPRKNIISASGKTRQEDKLEILVTHHDTEH